MFYQSKSVLVTGGAGFIGSHLYERLLDLRASVYCVDNLSSGLRANVDHLASHHDFHFVEHDITDPLALEIDAIFNLACPASLKSYQLDPIGTTRTCVLGAMNVLDIATRRNCRVFQASTSEVYGDPAQHPQVEGYFGNVNPIGPGACYDEGKRLAETLFFDYHRMRGVDIRVARIFNTYGPRMKTNDGRVVPNFVAQALAEDLLTVYGGGAQTRSFCYVDDLVDCILAMMAAGPEAIGPINLGAPFEMTVLALAEMIQRLTGAGSGIVNIQLPEDDPFQRRPDISRAQAVLGWTPRVEPEEGIMRVINHFSATESARFTKVPA